MSWTDKSFTPGGIQMSPTDAAWRQNAGGYVTPPGNYNTPSSGGFWSNLGGGINSVGNGLGGLAGWFASRFGNIFSGGMTNGFTPPDTGGRTGNTVANPAGIGTRLPTGIMGAGQSNALQMGTMANIMKRNQL